MPFVFNSGSGAGHSPLISTEQLFKNDQSCTSRLFCGFKLQHVCWEVILDKRQQRYPQWNSNQFQPSSRYIWSHLFNQSIWAFSWLWGVVPARLFMDKGFFFDFWMQPISPEVSRINQSPITVNGFEQSIKEKVLYIA